jgi:hypothetical protein
VSSAGAVDYMFYVEKNAVLTITNSFTRYNYLNFWDGANRTFSFQKHFIYAVGKVVMTNFKMKAGAE